MKSTLLLKKQKKYHRLPLRLFVSGIKKVKSVLLELNPTYEDTILRIYKTLLVAVLILKRKKKSVTVVFLPENKWMTLNDKKIFFFRHRFPNHKLVTDVGSGINWKRKGHERRSY